MTKLSRKTPKKMIYTSNCIDQNPYYSKFYVDFIAKKHF